MSSITTPSPASLNPWSPVTRTALEVLRRTVLENPYLAPYLRQTEGRFPSPPQALFLTAPVEEIGYGGAAGGGKSAALLAAALQYVDVAGYSALLLRQSYTDLMLPGALIPLSHEWLWGTNAKWNGSERQWHFPSGATIAFGFLSTDQDKYRYQSSQFQFIGFDELTQFSEEQYTFLHSRVRRTGSMAVPIRVRWASNPGGIGHDWVKKLFPVTSPVPIISQGRMFIPARLDDNPGLDREAYRKQLAKLDPVTRAQLEHGDWSVRPEGNLFKRHWFKIVEQAPENLGRVIRYWDLAATAKTKTNDPDWVSGCKMGTLDNGCRIILHVEHFRGSPETVEARVKQTTTLDGHQVGVYLEQEPGAASKLLVSQYRRNLLAGYQVESIPSATDKLTRARPFSAACERGQILLLNGPWIPAFLDELGAFPAVAHDDQVDSGSGAYNVLALRTTGGWA